MSFTVKLIAASLLGFWLVGAHGLESVRFNRASVEAGLSQSVAQAIVQDEVGFIWVGTQQGLNRYDGYEFDTYLHDPANTNSLSHDWIWDLQRAEDGSLWIGTAGGLNRLDPRSGQFTHYRHDPEDPETLGGDQVRVLVLDTQGRLWIGGDGGGISRFDQDTGKFKRYLNDPDDRNSLSSDRVKALYVDPSGFIWVGTDGGGLNRLDPVRDRITRISLGVDNARVRSIVADGHGMLWIGTSEQGLFELDPVKGVTRHYTHNPDDPSSISSNSIRELFIDDRQQLWIGTDSHGLNRFDPVTGSFLQLRHDPADVRSLSDDHIAAVFQDDGGVMWVGTYLGLNSWNPIMGAFRTFSRRGEAPGQISNNWIASFAEAADGSLLVGSAGGGIDRVDLASGKAERVDLVDGLSALTDERVFALAVDDREQLWAGTRAGGLNRYDPASDSWRAYRNDPADPASLSADGVTSLLLDTDGTLWVGTYLGGLNRYDPRTDSFQRFRHNADDSRSLCSDRVLALYQEQSGAIWVGTHDRGLCRFDPATLSFVGFQHDPTDDASLSSNAAWTMVEDANGNLWVGTSDAGLNLWRQSDRENGLGTFTRIGVEEGLSNPAVFGLLTDTHGQIWLSSSRGLTRISGESLEMRHYSAVDGLQSSDFNFGAALRSRGGQLLFGGGSGFNAFFPEKIGVNTHPPRVALTRFHRNYAVARIGDYQNTQGQLVLRHTDQLVTFEYAALDYTAPENNVYEHRLDGFDNGWVSDEGLHRVTYTNLQPGEYQLRVRAANNDGVWSEEELGIPIVVRPAPWHTWWARTAYLLAALGAAFLTYRFYAVKLEREATTNRMQASLIAEITERQIKEAELARTRERAQRYLDVVEVIILALANDGTVTMINQKGVRVLGYAESEILGRNFFECFVPEEHRDEIREQFADVQAYAYSESPIKPKEGNERLIAWHTIPVPEVPDGDEADAGGIIISGADVTQMRNIERQLREAQKMEALGTLARGIAHDFNNILSSILGYAELSQVEIGNRGKASEYLRNLETSVGRARSLVHRILTFGRGSGQPPQPVRVAEAAREALELLRPVTGANVSIEERLDQNCGSVLADQTQLVQVVLNLCTNASQAMADSGGVLRVELKAHTVGIEEARSLGVLVPGRHIRLTVSDTGPGMDDFTLARIFDPFFTTRHRDEGTGLGLSVVHGIVTQLGGCVQVFSQQGQGTRFEILLPCSPDEAGEAPATEGRSQVNPAGSETVLFVDDEESMRSIAEEALGNLGYRVVTASDGAEALKLFDTPGLEFDVVVTDQTMPNLLGHKLARAVKMRRPNVPVIIMSGAGRPPGDDIDFFVEKPFTLVSLGQAVRTVLARVT